MGNNPYHNQHIMEITECLDDALTAMEEYYTSILEEQQHEIDTLKTRLDTLETGEKPSPTELEVDVKISEKSKKSFRAQLMSLFRFMF